MRTSSMAAAFLVSTLAFSVGVPGSARAEELPAAPVPVDVQPSTSAPPAPGPAVSREPQTLAAKASARQRPLVSGWFAAPTFATTSFNGKVSASPGMRGGIYLDRQFAIGFHSRDLLCIQRQIITQHTGCFFCSDFTHCRHIIKNRCDIID